MAKRSAVDDVLGDESPLADLASLAAASTKRREKKAATVAPSPANGEAKVEAKPKPSPKPKERESERRRPSGKKASTGDSRAKRMMVSTEEERTIDDLIIQIGAAVGTKVQFAQVARAMWALLLEAEEGLERVPGPKLRRPANGDLEALAEFEAALASYLLEVFRKAPRRPR